MTVKLRPHHLLCFLTYVGKGYSPAFVENYDRIASRLTAGEDIAIVDGPDDICAPLLGSRNAHCTGASVRVRDAQAARDVGRLLGMTVTIGSRIANTPDMVRMLRSAFHEGTLRPACAGCEWSDLCTSIADHAYDNVRIAPAAI
ncbi:DUF1284 domain-containing protein [Falsirhodobacter sp. alg1]|uniref:DUF1284 domain-containing protein n=1 Tax=Falsirhodobacter sp. alg1 TaxID=1472418 RepID=UPI0005F076EF|nr:DUF1284 domain-containing protein [Falsirhodobacter sp. alg1]